MTQRKQTTVRFGRKFVRVGTGGEAVAGAGARASKGTGTGAGARDSADVKLIGTMSEIARSGYLSTLHSFLFGPLLSIMFLFSFYLTSETTNIHKSFFF